jgi:hypothetical protein
MGVLGSCRGAGEVEGVGSRLKRPAFRLFSHIASIEDLAKVASLLFLPAPKRTHGDWILFACMSMLLSKSREFGVFGNEHKPTDAFSIRSSHD